MAPSELFNKPVDGLRCPLCLSHNYSLVAECDPKRGILRSVYLCGDCRSYFGDMREFDAKNGDADGKP